MMKLLKYTVGAIITLSLSACSNPYLLYRVEVQQGNLIAERDVHKIKKGMSMNEVRDILGEPVLIDTFNIERWNYVYTLRTNGKKAQQHNLTLIFKNDHLVKIFDDVSPSDQSTKADKSPRDPHPAESVKVTPFG